MAEVIRAFDEPVRDAFGEYRAQAVGRELADGMWEGWLEFIPIDGSTEVLVTPVETTQPGKDRLTYWATGLTSVFLEGALERARNPVMVKVRTVELPASEAPAPRDVVSVSRVMPPGPEPVLDPFEIGGRSLDVLRQELGALDRPRLLNIINAYHLNPAGEDLSWMSDHQLVHFIVVAVDTQIAQRAR